MTSSMLVSKVLGLGLSILGGIGGFKVCAAEPVAIGPSPLDHAARAVCNPTLAWSLSRTTVLGNGSFESSSMLPWMSAAAGLRRAWVRELAMSTPFDAQYVATPVSSGAPVAEMYQDVYLPANVDYVTLFWGERLPIYSGERDALAFLKVMVRDLSDLPLQDLVTTQPEPGEPAAWQYRSADLSAWRGRQVRLAFVAGTGANGTWRPKVDGVRVLTGSTNGIAFNVYLGSSTNLVPADLLGTSTAPLWSLGRLPALSTNYWRVDTVTPTNTVTGEVWQFTVGPEGPLHHFAFGPLLLPQLANIPSPVILTAEDAFNHVVTNFNSQVALAAYSESLREPGVLISEIAGSTRDGIEFMNTGTKTQDMSGWQVFVYGGNTVDQPLFRVIVPNETVLGPGELLAMREPGAGSPLPVPEIACPSINWSASSGISASVLLLDAASNIVDFVTVGLRQATNIVVPFAVPPAEWRDYSVGGGVGSPWSRQRWGRRDNNSADDWLSSSSVQLGSVKPGLSAPLLPGFAPMPFTTSSPPVLVSGVWTGGVSFNASASNVFLQASSTGAIASASRRFEVQEKPYVFLSAADLREGDGEMPGALVARLQVVRALDTVISLVATPAGEAQVPSVVVIPAGSLEVAAALWAVDDLLLDGPQTVSISGSSLGVTVLPTTFTVRDNETAALGLQGPAELAEGGSTWVTVTANKPPAKDIVVAVHADPPDRLQIWPSLKLEAGKTTASFPLAAVEDTWIDGTTSGKVWVTVDNWTAATNEFLLLDNESTNFVLTVPASVAENAGTRTNACRVALSGRTRTNLTVQLSTSPPNQIILPPTVAIPAGQSFVWFNLTVVQDDVAEGDIDISVRATAPAFGDGGAKVRLLDDDPASLELDPVSSPQFAGVTFTNQVNALGPDGQPLQTGSFLVEMLLVTPTATKLLTTATVTNGQAKVAITLPEGGFGLRLRAKAGEVQGESNPFNVIQPTQHVFPEGIRDIAWLASRQLLLAAVPTAAVSHPGEVVSVDPSTGDLSTWAVVPGGITASNSWNGRMSVSPTGDRLFLAARAGEEVQVWDTQNRGLVGSYTVPSGQRIADMAVTRADPWRLLVALARTNGFSENPVILDASLTPGTLPVSQWLRSVLAHPAFPETFFVFRPYEIDQWQTGPAGVLSGKQIRGGPYADVFLPMAIVNNRLFVGRDGYVADLGSGSQVGAMAVPSGSSRVALVTSDDFRREVLVASTASTTTMRIQSYDARDCQIRREIITPFVLAAERRMLLCGSNLLAVAAGDKLALINWPAAPAGPAAVDIGLLPRSLTPEPRIGTDWLWSVTLTNSGTTTASDIRVRAPLPSETVVMGSSLPGGRTWTEGNTLHGHILELRAGAAATLNFTLRPQTGGFTTNAFSVVADQDELNAEDNSAEFVNFVATSGKPDSVEPLRLPIRELVFDSARKIIYGLERVAKTATQTRLFKLNSQTLQPEVIRDLSGPAVYLRLSSDCQFLYAAVREGRAVQRIDLTGTEQDLLFDTFDPPPPMRYWCLDMAVDPSDPRRLVFVGCSEKPGYYFETVAAAFQDGVKQPAVFSYTEGSAGMEAVLQIDPASQIAVLGTARWPDRLVERMQLTADGLQLVGEYTHEGLAAGFLLAGDRLYSAFGEELDLDSGRSLRNLPQDGTGYGLLGLEQVNDRLVFLQYSSGSAGSIVRWPLRIFDRGTLGRLADLSVPLAGKADSLVVLDQGRLAIASDDSRVTVVTTSALGSGPGTDLAVQLLVQPPSPTVNEPVTITLTVTNKGPLDVSSASITCELPGGFTRTSTTPTPRLGNGYGIFPYPILWTDTAIPVGSNLTCVIQGKFTLADRFLIAAGAADPGVDSAKEDNRATLTVPVSWALAPGQSAQLGAKVVDALYDAARERILVIVGPDHEYGGELAAINPTSGLIVQHSNVGPNPSLLAISDNSQTLHALLNSGADLVRIDPATLQVQRRTSFGRTPQGYPIKARSLSVNPGAPTEVLAHLDDNTFDLYRDCEFVPPEIPASGGNLKFFAPNAAMALRNAYPFSLGRFLVTDTGLQFDGEGGPYQIEKFTTAGGLLFAVDGRLVDPFTFTQLGTFAAYGPVVFSPESALVYYPTPVNDIGLRIFDLTTQALVKEEKAGTGFGYAPVDMFRAGSDLVAGRYPYGELILIRTATAPIGPAADLEVQLDSRSIWRSGEICEWDVVVTNRGPNPASAVRVDLRMPSGMTFANATVTAASAVEPNASFVLGTLQPNQAASFSVRAVARAAAFAGQLVASARSSAIDPNLVNNVAQITKAIESSPLPNRVDTLPIPADNLIYDPVSRLLYLACSELEPGVTNRLLSLDPARGLVVRNVAMPGRPGEMALSGGGEYLYVALDLGARVARVVLPSMELDQVFDTLRDDSVLPRPECDMEVIAGLPRSVVVSRFGGGYPSPGGVWVYDDGRPRPKFIAGGYDGLTYLAPGTSPDNLISLDTSTAKLRQLLITGDGLSIGPAPAPDNPLSSLDAFAGGSTVLSGIDVYSRTNLQYRGQVSATFSPQAVALSADGARIVCVARSYRAENPVDFAGFRTDTLQLLGTIETPGPSSQFTRLVLWGDDGVAALAGPNLLLGHLDLAATLSTDTDSDGMPDGWEMAHQLNPIGVDASEDPDGDGATNLQEYLFDTDPQSGLSSPRLYPNLLESGPLRLLFRCRSGLRLAVETSDTLGSPAWTTVSELVSSGGWQVYATATYARPAAYFRIRAVR